MRSKKRVTDVTAGQNPTKSERQKLMTGPPEADPQRQDAVSKLLTKLEQISWRAYLERKNRQHGK
jgi:hypothetical protein